MAQAHKGTDSTIGSKQGPPPILPGAEYFHEPASNVDRVTSETAPTRTNSMSAVPLVTRPDPMPATKSYNAGQEKKMHQTSTRIMRTNPDGRPFAKVGKAIKYDSFGLLMRLRIFMICFLR